MTKDESIAHMFASRAQTLENESRLAASDAEHWLRSRAAIIDAIEKAGFQLMSNRHGFWLEPR